MYKYHRVTWSRENVIETSEVGLSYKYLGRLYVRVNTYKFLFCWCNLNNMIITKKLLGTNKYDIVIVALYIWTWFWFEDLDIPIRTRRLYANHRFVSHKSHRLGLFYTTNREVISIYNPFELQRLPDKSLGYLQRTCCGNLLARKNLTTYILIYL